LQWTNTIAYYKNLQITAVLKDRPERVSGFADGDGGVEPPELVHQFQKLRIARVGSGLDERMDVVVERESPLSNFFLLRNND
jgi:hypothetical protein